MWICGHNSDFSLYQSYTFTEVVNGPIISARHGVTLVSAFPWEHEIFRHPSDKAPRSIDIKF